MTGQISFGIGSAVQIVNGQAHITTNTAPNFLATGSDAIEASYSGDQNYGESSGDVMVFVDPQPGTDFSVTATPSSQTIPRDEVSSPVTVTVMPLNGFSGTVNFSQATCSISPAGSFSTCSMPSVALRSGGTFQVLIYTAGASSEAWRLRAHPDDIAGLGMLASVALCGFGFMVVFSKKRRGLSVASGMALVALVAVCLGCGGGKATESNQGTPTPRGVTYTVIVPGTCASVTHNATFIFVVQ